MMGVGRFALHYNFSYVHDKIHIAAAEAAAPAVAPAAALAAAPWIHGSISVINHTFYH